MKFNFYISPLILSLFLVFQISSFAQSGNLDITFDSDGKVLTPIGGGGDYARSMAIQPDGKILVAGDANNGINGDFAIARFNSDGSLDLTFDADGKLTTPIGTSSGINSIALQPDGKILVAGYTYTSNFDFALARYNSNGSLDLTFDTDGVVITPFGSGEDRIYSIVIQPDGKIVAAGHSYNGTNNDFALARYNSDGSLDITFETDGKLTTAILSNNDEAYSAVLQPDGKIVVGGSSTTGTNYDFSLVRYNSDGSLDISFSNDGKLTTAIGTSYDYANSIVLQTDGKIVAAGTSSIAGNYDFALARYNTDGSLDLTFDTDGKVTTSYGSNLDYIASIVIQSDGKIIAAGRSGIGADYDFALARYNSNGNLDITFGTDGKIITVFGSGEDRISSIALQPDGKIVAAGYSNNGGNRDFALARYNVSTCTNTGSTLSQIACNNFTWNGTTYTTSGTYNKIISNAAGCDSLMTLNLTISTAFKDTIEVATCSNYTWRGTTYTATGIYTKTVTGGTCDSIFTLDLIINPSTSSVSTVTACNSYTWNGTTYTFSGTYTKTIVNSKGCDSLMTLNLMINTSTSSASTVTSCNTYTWNGTTYASSGTYPKTIPNSKGCDSLMTLNLTINTSTISVFTISSCNSYNWNGTTYNSSGSYNKTIPNSKGCDSLMTLNLTIKQITSSTETQTACDSYTWNGTTYANSGTYSKTIPNNAGCDSVMTLILTINNTPSITNTTPGSRCGAGIVTLSATASAGTLNWYAASTGGMSLGTGAIFTTPSISSTTAYYVDASGTCDTSSRTAVVASINSALGAIGSIIGNTTVCSGTENTYSVSPVADALSYTWTLPLGWLGSSGTSNSIIATAGTQDGSITVKANNACGSTAVQTLAVNVNTVDATVTQNGSTLVANALTGTFKWVDCSNGFASINGANQHSFTPTVSGSYALVASQNGCSDTSGCFTVNVNPVGISENTFEGLNIYPNPTNKSITIDLGKSYKELSIEVRNVMGQLVQIKKVENASTININIEGSSAIYFVEIKNNLGFKTIKKIIKN